MKQLSINLPDLNLGAGVKIGLLLTALLWLWPFGQQLIMRLDVNAGYIDPGIWLLLLLSVIAFLMMVGLSYLLLQWLWNGLGLPKIDIMVLQVKNMELWQQLGLLLACFASLLFAGVGCLIAIC
ncbi:hypothetical protein [Pedobacter gandavensis]|uniref:hypothetical protein n=1 Tax=Pedobacter gandavensis TaxID=2679963 RepID=UPI00292EFCF3|nr:hypothetical protein [Pedobacter gandavensis]